jgi:cell division protein FtsB
VKASYLLGVVAVVVGITFALLGGEYKIHHWLQLKDEQRGLEDAVERLEFEIDSLSLLADSIEGDSLKLERVAREDLGMLRDGEVLFRVEEASP